MDLQQIALIALSGLGVFHGLFCAILLWKKGVANQLLSLLMVILSLRIGKSVVLIFSENLETIYIYLGLCLLMFIGPLFFLYCMAIIKKQQPVKRKNVFHFLPGFIFLALGVPFHLIGFHQLPDTLVVSLFAVFYGHYLSYLLITGKAIRNQANKSTPEVKTWLHVLFYGLLSVWMVYVLNLFEEKIPYILGPVCYSATVYVITYLAVTRNYIRAVHSIKYQTTSISEAEINGIYRDMEKAMQERQLFLDPELSLALLSQHVKTGTQKLSLVINSRAGCNFNEYVNRYRVRHAIHLMENAKADLLKIASIAFDSGFNSLSSFNHAFKKCTGKTPSEFRSNRMAGKSS